MKLTILEVLSLGERVVLAADHEAFVTWNQSATFQMYLVDAFGGCEEIDIRTVYYPRATERMTDQQKGRQWVWAREKAVDFLANPNGGG